MMRMQWREGVNVRDVSGIVHTGFETSNEDRMAQEAFIGCRNWCHYGDAGYGDSWNYSRTSDFVTCLVCSTLRVVAKQIVSCR